MINEIKEWHAQNIQLFCEHLKTFKNTVKGDFTKRVYNTKKVCLAVKVPILKNFAKQILKTNYLEFINNCPTNIIELNLIRGTLICNVKDLNLQKKLLCEYSKICDSWVETDIIKLKINNENENFYFDFAQDLLREKHIFARRLGVIILFNYINKKYIKKIFELINNLHNEQEYYVNMAISWLLCECLIKQRNETINYLNNHNLNNFVLNKFISKCKDSFRVDIQDKILLNNYKK